MKLRNPAVSGILTVTGIAAGITLVLMWSYPLVWRTFFAGLPEAEVQTYLAGLGAFLLLLPLMVTLIGRIRLPAPTPADVRLLSAYAPLAGLLSAVLAAAYVSGPSGAAQIRQFGIETASLPVRGYAVSFLAAGAAMALLFGTGRAPWQGLRTPLFLTAVFLIVVSTFHVGRMAYYDATHFAGPINDLRLGEAPLSSPSWYGLLPAVLFSVLFRFVPLTLLNIYIAVAVAETAGYVLLYLFILKLWDDRWAVAVTASAVLFHFLVQSVDRNYYLQSTFFRFGIWLPVAFVLRAAAGNGPARMVRDPRVLAAVTLAVFWTTDMGIYVTGAFAATVWFLTSGKTFLGSVIRTAVALLPLAVSVAVGFALLSAAVLAAYRSAPQWGNYWAFTWQYRTIPMFALPIPASPFPVLSLLIPLITVGAMLGRKAHGNMQSRDVPVLFAAFLSLFFLTYFAGDSHLNSLRTINLPGIVCAAWLIRELMDWLRAQHRRIAVPVLLSLALAGTVPLAVWGNQALTNLRHGNILSTVREIRQPSVTEYDIVGPTAVAVRQAYADTIARRDFALVSPWDSWYLTIWKSTNALGSNCLLCYWTPEMARPLTESATRLTVRYLFVDRNRDGYEGRVSWIMTPELGRRYRLVDRIGELDIYERI